MSKVDWLHTWAISSGVVTGLEFFFNSSTILSTAIITPTQQKGQLYKVYIKSCQKSFKKIKNSLK